MAPGADGVPHVRVMVSVTSTGPPLGLNATVSVRSITGYMADTATESAQAGSFIAAMALTYPVAPTVSNVIAPVYSVDDVSATCPGTVVKKIIAPGVPDEAVTSPLNTNVVPSTGENVGVAVMDWMRNTSGPTTADGWYSPAFAQIAFTVTVPAVANVTLPPDSTVDEVVGVDPSVEK